MDKLFTKMFITEKLLVLANGKKAKIIVSSNTKTIAIIKKLIAGLLTKKQLLTILK